MKIKAIIIMLISLIISSCSQKYLPVQENNIEISGDYAVLRTNFKMIAVKETFWTIEPQYLSNYYTTFNVKIQNRSKEMLSIKHSDFALIDEKNMQFDTLPTEQILDMMLQDSSLIPDRFAISVETQRENAARISEIRRNILSKSFNFGEIHPGAYKEGILFFPKLDNKNQEFRFIYKSHEIKFKKTKN